MWADRPGLYASLEGDGRLTMKPYSPLGEEILMKRKGSTGVDLLRDDPFLVGVEFELVIDDIDL